MPSVTVVDTSCLILLNKIGRLKLLSKLFDKVTITQTVADEFNKSLPDWISVVSIDSNDIRGLASFLDKGEATSIAFALNHLNSLLLIDENKGRKVAKEIGLDITGSLGVLTAAKQQGHIDAVKPILKEVQQTNFRISERLIRTVLDNVNEL